MSHLPAKVIETRLKNHEYPVTCIILWLLCKQDTRIHFYTNIIMYTRRCAAASGH